MDKMTTLADMLPVPSHADTDVKLQFGESNPLILIHKGRLLNVTEVMVTYGTKDYFTGIFLACMEESVLGNLQYTIRAINNPEDYIVYNGSEAQKVLYLND